MASATATWTPTSLQLRLALSSGVRRKSNAVYLRPSRIGCGVVCCVSQKPEVEAWTGSDSSKPSADGLAGWDDSVNDNKSSRAKKKSFIEGIRGLSCLLFCFQFFLSFLCSLWISLAQLVNIWLQIHWVCRLRIRLQSLWRCILDEVVTVYILKW